MGFLSFLDKPFRTGRSQAQREQRRAAERADEQAEKVQELSQQFLDLTRPSIELGTENLKSFSRLSDPNQLDSVFGGLVNSNLANSIINERQKAATQFAASSGLRRSGAGIKAAAKVPTDVLMGLLDRVTGIKQNSASIGLGQGGNFLGGLKGLLTPTDNAGNAMATNAANNMMVKDKALSAITNVASAIFSDERVKENIERIGEFENGIGIYSYNYVGDTSRTIGVLAHEVEETLPHAVLEEYGLKKVNYEALAL